MPHASLLVHACAFLSHHNHLLVTVADAHQVAHFMNYLNSSLAREAGRLVLWRERFRGWRYEAVLVSYEVAAQVARLEFALAHGGKVGFANWHDRTLASRARRQVPRTQSENGYRSKRNLFRTTPASRRAGRTTSKRTTRRELGDLIVALFRN